MSAWEIFVVDAAHGTEILPGEAHWPVSAEISATPPLSPFCSPSWSSLEPISIASWSLTFSFMLFYLSLFSGLHVGCFPKENIYLCCIFKCVCVCIWWRSHGNREWFRPSSLEQLPGGAAMSTVHCKGEESRGVGLGSYPESPWGADVLACRRGWNGGEKQGWGLYFPTENLTGTQEAPWHWLQGRHWAADLRGDTGLELRLSLCLPTCLSFRPARLSFGPACPLSCLSTSFWGV